MYLNLRTEAVEITQKRVSSHLSSAAKSEEPGLFVRQIYPQSTPSEAPSMRSQISATVGFPLSSEIKRMILEYFTTRKLSKTNMQYVNCMALERSVIAGSFFSDSPTQRLEGMRKLTALRHDLAFKLFTNTLRPHIETLMLLHGDERKFDEAVCIYGFNRLFTREYASAGTDIDFTLVIDSEDPHLVQEIRTFVEGTVKPQLKNVGMDMETADYLILGLSTYTPKLNNTRESLFTLANRLLA